MILNGFCFLFKCTCDIFIQTPALIFSKQPVIELMRSECFFYLTSCELISDTELGVQTKCYPVKYYNE